MAAPEEFRNGALKALRTYATSLPETVEGTSCVKRAFKCGKKNYLFLGESEKECNVMLKLKDAIDDATELAAEVDGITVGKAGWVTIRFQGRGKVPRATLKAWIRESYALMATKTLRAALDAM